VKPAELPQRLLDLLYPPRCAGCGRGGAWYCALCRTLTRPVPQPYCQRCGQPLTGSDCRSCAVSLPVVDAVRAATLFAGPIRQAIHRLKYSNLTAVAPALSQLLAETYQEAGWSADVIVPVPLYPARQRQRGYNQAERLARPLATALAIPLAAQAMRRQRATADQIGLDPAGRRANVLGAFAVVQGGSVAGRTVLLIDDVATTGSTLDACARALFEGGAVSVRALVLARRSLDDERRTTGKGQD
jgi:ComF family protein